MQNDATDGFLVAILLVFIFVLGIAVGYPNTDKVKFACEDYEVSSDVVTGINCLIN